MAQGAGHRHNLSWVRRAALWAGAKMASYGGGVAFDLRDARAGMYLGGTPSISGKVVNDDTALRITTAFACVRVLAETVGSVTLGVYERQKNGNAQRVDHDLARILVERPNIDMSGMVYREALTTNLAARGNAYSFLERNGVGTAVSLYPIPSAKVDVVRDQSTNWEVKYKINDRGRTEAYPADKIWHWKGFGYDGLKGLSPIQCAREALGLALAGEEFNARLFANGLSTTAIVSFPGWLKPDQRKLAEDKLARMHEGLLNVGKPYIVEGGMKIEPGIFAPEDAQFLQLRQFQVPEICRIWRISPHMIAALERATNNNIEQLSLEFVMYTMLPYFRRIEEAAQQLFKPAERGRYFVRFNFESLLRADSTARAGLYSILLQNGVYSRNEVRELENRNRSEEPGMDGYTVQSNMAPIEALMALLMSRQTAQPPVKAEQPEMEFKQFAGAAELRGVIARWTDGMAELSAAIREAPAPIVPLTVHVPQQRVKFEAVLPEVKAPDVHVAVAGAEVNVPAPVVNVEVKAAPVSALPPWPTETTITERDASGRAKTMETRPVQK